MDYSILTLDKLPRLSANKFLLENSCRILQIAPPCVWQGGFVTSALPVVGVCDRIKFLSSPYHLEVQMGIMIWDGHAEFWQHFPMAEELRNRAKFKIELVKGLNAAA